MLLIDNKDIDCYLSGSYKFIKLDNGFTKLEDSFLNPITLIEEVPRDMDKAYVFCFNVLHWFEFGSEIIIRFSESTKLQEFENEQIKIILGIHDSIDIEKKIIYINEFNKYYLFLMVMFLYCVILFEVEGEILSNNKKYISFRDGYLYFTCDGLEHKNKLDSILHFTKDHDYMIFFKPSIGSKDKEVT